MDVLTRSRRIRTAIAWQPPDTTPGPAKPRWVLAMTCVTVGAVLGLVVGAFAAAPQDALTHTFFRNGVWSVPDQVPAGTYRTDGVTASGQTCIWDRLRDLSGSPSATIAGGMVTGPTTVTVAATDRGLSVSGGCLWSLV